MEWYYVLFVMRQESGRVTVHHADVNPETDKAEQIRMAMILNHHRKLTDMDDEVAERPLRMPVKIRYFVVSESELRREWSHALMH